MSERVRFQGDEDFHTQIIKGLRQRQPLIDFQTTNEANLRGLPDLTRLALAAEQGRVLVSHDLKTMPTHFAEFLASGQHSTGLILIPQRAPIGPVIDDLYLIWGASTPEYWLDRIEYLPLRTPL